MLPDLLVSQVYFPRILYLILLYIQVISCCIPVLFQETFKSFGSDLSNLLAEVRIIDMFLLFRFNSFDRCSGFILATEFLLSLTFGSCFSTLQLSIFSNQSISSYAWIYLLFRMLFVLFSFIVSNYILHVANDSKIEQVFVSSIYIALIEAIQSLFSLFFSFYHSFSNKDHNTSKLEAFMKMMHLFVKDLVNVESPSSFLVVKHFLIVLVLFSSI
jgi:hypothetical protein